MSFIPNTTPTPNWLYNGEMKKMTETELKVVLLVTRKTLGWFDPMTHERKTQDYISQSQFMEFTGKSNRAIATAIQVCVKTGWIIAKDRQGTLCNTPEKRRRRKVWYQLGSVFTNKISSEESSQDNNLVNITTQSSEHNDINLVKKVHNTKETLTKETNTNVASDTFSFKEELKKIMEGKRKDLKIIALYFIKKGLVFKNQQQFNANLVEELRNAKKLIGYSKEELEKIMDFCEADSKKNEYEWKLSTVVKKSSITINKI